MSFPEYDPVLPHTFWDREWELQDIVNVTALDLMKQNNVFGGYFFSKNSQFASFESYWVFNKHLHGIICHWWKKMASFILYIKWNCKGVLCMASYLFPLSSPAFFYLVNAFYSSSQHFSPNIIIWYSLTRAVFLILREVRLEIRVCIPRDRSIDFTASDEDWLGLG